MSHSGETPLDRTPATTGIKVPGRTLSVIEQVDDGRVNPDTLYSTVKKSLTSDEQPSANRQSRRQHVKSYLKKIFREVATAYSVNDPELMAESLVDTGGMRLEREKDSDWVAARNRLRSTGIYFSDDDLPPDGTHISDFNLSFSSPTEIARNIGSLVEKEGLHESTVKTQNITYTEVAGRSGVGFDDQYVKRLNPDGTSTLLYAGVTEGGSDLLGRMARRHAAFEGPEGIEGVELFDAVEHEAVPLAEKDIYGSIESLVEDAPDIDRRGEQLAEAVHKAHLYARRAIDSEAVVSLDQSPRLRVKKRLNNGFDTERAEIIYDRCLRQSIGELCVELGGSEVRVKDESDIRTYSDGIAEAPSVTEVLNGLDWDFSPSEDLVSDTFDWGAVRDYSAAVGTLAHRDAFGYLDGVDSEALNGRPEKRAEQTLRNFDDKADLDREDEHDPVKSVLKWKGEFPGAFVNEDYRNDMGEFSMWEYAKQDLESVQDVWTDPDLQRAMGLSDGEVLEAEKAFKAMYRGLEYAGRMDLVAEHGRTGENMLIDLKTSSDFYTKYALQTNAYRYAAETVPYIDVEEIDRVMVPVISDNEFGGSSVKVYTDAPVDADEWGYGADTGLFDCERYHKAEGIDAEWSATGVDYRKAMMDVFTRPLEVGSQ